MFCHYLKKAYVLMSYKPKTKLKFLYQAIQLAEELYINFDVCQKSVCSNFFPSTIKFLAIFCLFNLICRWLLLTLDSPCKSIVDVNNSITCHNSSSINNSNNNSYNNSYNNSIEFFVFKKSLFWIEKLFPVLPNDPKREIAKLKSLRPFQVNDPKTSLDCLPRYIPLLIQIWRLGVGLTFSDSLENGISGSKTPWILSIH